MILRIDGDISRYYVETLCLVFFPGSTFGENEEPKPGVPKVSVSVYSDVDGNSVANVTIKLNDKITTTTQTVSHEETVAIATHSAIAVGRAMFAAGKEMLGHIPPWGILTGVRPAKVAAGFLHDGRGVNKAKRILCDEYFLNPQKAALAVSVASNEARIIKALDRNTCSLYISIPFCPTRCSYCSFVSYTTPRLLSMIDEYIDALLFDLEETVSVIKAIGMRINTVYIGGGTPTTLSAAQLERLLTTLARLVDVYSLDEFTMEAGRPDTITKEKLDVAVKYGVTRVSVNPQTLSDEILKEIGRRHTVEEFFRAYDIVAASGVRDINVDLIAGLPGDDFKNFSSTIDRIIQLRPSNITVHTFCVKRASDALKNNSGIYSINGGDVAKSVSYAQLATKFSGYKPYYMYRQKNTVGNLENVGFCLEGREGLYNIYMMEEVQTIFAVGAGSVTKLVDFQDSGAKTRIERFFKPKYPYEYLREAEARVSGEDIQRKSLRENVEKFFFHK